MAKERLRHLWPFIANVIILAAVISLGFVFGLHPDYQTSFYIRSADILLIIALSLLFVVMVVEFISPFFVSDATFNTAFAALGIFFVCFFSRDGLKTMNIGVPDFAPQYHTIVIWDFLECFSYFFAMVFLFRFATQDSKHEVDRRFAVISIVVIAADFLLFSGLYWVGLDWIAIFIGVGFSLVWTIALHHAFVSNEKWTTTIGLAMAIALLLSVFILNEAVGRAAPDRYLGRGLGGIVGILIPICFLLIYLAFAMRTVKAARDKQKVQAKLDDLQTSILKNQISAHFFFNTLDLVKTLYRVSLSKGDLAMDLLSKLLRAYTTSDDKYLIPLEKELDLLSSYLELHNLKGGKKYTLLFNVDAYDYLVPSFSLQPLLENAIQHSKTDEKEDGFFEVDSFQEGERYLLRFLDNGVGFDPKSVGGDSVGLRNTEQRFRILLGAKMSIESKVGEGTVVTLSIPKDQSKSWEFKK